MEPPFECRTLDEISGREIFVTDRTGKVLRRLGRYLFGMCRRFWQIAPVLQVLEL